MNQCVFAFICFTMQLVLSMPVQAVTVGSKNFTEQMILSEIFTQLLEEHLDAPVTQMAGLGGTQIAFHALTSNSIDVYPEYTGTGLLSILGEPMDANPRRSFLSAQRKFRTAYQVEWLLPLGFENGYALVVKNTDKMTNVVRLSDLKEHKDKLRIGAIPEFIKRADGWSPLAERYGLDPAKVEAVSLDIGLMHTALKNGEVDLIVTFSTDGRIEGYHLKELEDDLQFIPSYQAAPLVSQAAIINNPALPGVLSLLGGAITKDQMREMNWQVDGLGRSPKAVATEFLAKSGLLDNITAASDFSADESLPHYFLENSRYLLTLLRQHLFMTASAILCAMLIGVPSGIFLTRFEKLSPPFFTAINTVQTIPSLALLGFLIPIMGIGMAPAIVTLFLYSLLPIIRNTYTGIKQIPPEIIESACAIGLTDWQTLKKIELPLATPTIIAGIRTSTVIIVGTATLAALIGAGGFGEPIFQGISMVRTHLILLGAIPASLLAVVLDRLLQRLEDAFASPCSTAIQS